MSHYHTLEISLGFDFYVKQASHTSGNCICTCIRINVWWLMSYFYLPTCFLMMNLKLQPKQELKDIQTEGLS